MVKFSPAGNVMFIRQDSETFNLYCPKTNYTVKAEKSDYHVYHLANVTESTNNIDFQSNIAVLCDDITIPRVKLYCESCKKEQVVSQIRNKDYSVTNICCKCKKYWSL